MEAEQIQVQNILQKGSVNDISQQGASNMSQSQFSTTVQHPSLATHQIVRILDTNTKNTFLMMDKQTGQLSVWKKFAIMNEGDRRMIFGIFSHN
ncbi:MAG: hypothetical protein EZS28_012358 [Streblomastix strix]|uniref:Uncharacterized protein n=1 Tax=Streblomastix strix TaxID=222440 RepID=A0A5J4WB21_9EUKA|nr:MAG: hypothetical protein EZS28_012358 [Streblomastix strix]